MVFRAPSTSLGAALVASALCLGACATGGYRSELEPFPRTGDYDYDLAALPEARVHAIDLRADGFDWPDVVDAADTAFLEVTLSASRGQQPSIESRLGDVALVQFFETAGRGRRYLDVSPFLQAAPGAGNRVKMLGTGVVWRTGTTRLVIFDNPEIAGRRTLVVAPHPDDAEIAAFGVYSTARADVVTVTAGDAGGANFGALWPEPGDHYRTKGWIRTLDSLTVPFLGGLDPASVRNLGYYDATLRTLWKERPAAAVPPLARLAEPGFYRRLNFDPELRDRPFDGSWTALVADLRAELERVRPQTIVAPHPLLDRHGDHQFTAIALFEALADWGGDCELLLFTNHAVGNEAFPLGPRHGMTGLPAWNGGSLHLRRLYSHPLSAEDRRRKLVALEAMHDLRPFDLRDGGPQRSAPDPYDYFRRAARPNEIFLVTDPQGAAEIRRSFLETLD